MSSLMADNEQAKTYISELKNPFAKDCVKSIMFYVYKSPFAPFDVSFTSFVDFVNGDTEGKQKITASDFATLVQKTENFVKSL